ADGEAVEDPSVSRPYKEHAGGSEVGKDVVGEEAQFVDTGHEARGDAEGTGAGGPGAARSLGAAHVGPGEQGGGRGAGEVQADPVRGGGGGDATPGRSHGSARADRAGTDAQEGPGCGDREGSAGAETGEDVVGKETEFIGAGREPGRDDEGAGAGGACGA